VIFSHPFFLTHTSRSGTAMGEWVRTCLCILGRIYCTNQRHSTLQSATTTCARRATAPHSAYVCSPPNSYTATKSIPLCSLLAWYSSPVLRTSRLLLHLYPCAQCSRSPSYLQTHMTTGITLETHTNQRSSLSSTDTRQSVNEHTTTGCR
jgi:hypothetical protein